MMSTIMKTKKTDRFCFEGSWVLFFIELFTALIGIASCVMLFWVPTITIAQIVWVVGVLMVTIYTFIGDIFSCEDFCRPMLVQMVFTYATFASVIIWLTTSFWWCLIPMAIGSMIAFSIAFPHDIVAIWLLSSAVCIFMNFCGMQIDVKNYEKSHEAQEVVTISNIGSDVIFVEGQDEPLYFSRSRQVSELELKKGDVVKILRHPRNEDKILSMSVVERRSE